MAKVQVGVKIYGRSAAGAGLPRYAVGFDGKARVRFTRRYAGV